MSSLIDIYVRDKQSGRIHRVGDITTSSQLVEMASSITSICTTEMAAAPAIHGVTDAGMNLCRTSTITDLTMIHGR